MKKVISLVMCIILAFSMSTVSLASSGTASVIENSFIFTDSEGKSNELISSYQDGISRVEHYINGQLINISESRLIDSDKIETTFTDVLKDTKTTYFDSVSEYIDYSSVSIDTGDTIEAAPYVLKGRINYKTVYGSLGDAYNYKLGVYQQMEDAYNRYKYVTAGAGDAVSYIVSTVLSVIAAIFSPPVSTVSGLVYAAATAAGVTITGGIIQSAFTKRYYVQSNSISYRIYDVDSSRYQYYSGERYRIALDGGGYSSEYYYDGYAPWNDSTNAYHFFCDFFSGQYAGVSSYTYY